MPATLLGAGLREGVRFAVATMKPGKRHSAEKRLTKSALRLIGALVVAAGQVAACAQASSRALVLDRFDRVINRLGITLVDWEGPIANPAPEFRVVLPDVSDFPVDISLSANGARLYFDSPSVVHPSGPAKRARVVEGEACTFRLAVFPDRDSKDESYVLTVEFIDARGAKHTEDVPIKVLDQDRPVDNNFPISVVFDEDRSGFFEDELRRKIFQQAADDWAFFLVDTTRAPVPSGCQRQWVWAWPLAWSGPPPRGYMVTNERSYRGLQVYAVGHRSPDMRAKSSRSEWLYSEEREGRPPLPVSGIIALGVDGCRDQAGWFLGESADDWMLAGVRIGRPKDLYSVAVHEIGHILAFNSAMPRVIKDQSVVRYYGRQVEVQSQEYHLKLIVDPASGQRAFGNEDADNMPEGRHLITKLDLLMLRAAGYQLRNVTPLAPLAVATDLPDALVGDTYKADIAVTGGVPLLDFDCDAHSLPKGLVVDRVSGTISGTPEVEGCFRPTITVRDYLGDSVTETLMLHVLIETR